MAGQPFPKLPGIALSAGGEFDRLPVAPPGILPGELDEARVVRPVAPRMARVLFEVVAVRIAMAVPLGKLFFVQGMRLSARYIE